MLQNLYVSVAVKSDQNSPLLLQAPSPDNILPLNCTLYRTHCLERHRTSVVLWWKLLSHFPLHVSINSISFSVYIRNQWQVENVTIIDNNVILNSGMVDLRNRNNILVHKDLWKNNIKKPWIYWDYSKNIFLDMLQRH